MAIPNGLREANFLICHANLTDDQESVRYSINKNYDLWRFEVHEQGLFKAADNNSPPTPAPMFRRGFRRMASMCFISRCRGRGRIMDVFNLCVLPLDEGETPSRG